MGIVINRKTLMPKEILRLASPVLLCSSCPVYETTIVDSGFQSISLNLPLAKALLGKSENETIASISDIIFGLLPKQKQIYLTDYEMLFDPRYMLDVVKLFCEISRHHKLFAKWLGGFSDDSLTYAEPGFDDYAKYRVSDYEITCVV